MSDYNVQAEIEDIIVTAGDTIDMSFSVYKNDVLYNMTGMQLDIHILDSNGTSIKDLSSAGGSPAITISTTSFNISTSAITTVGKYFYDVQLTSSGVVNTIRKGNFIIQKQITT